MSRRTAQIVSELPGSGAVQISASVEVEEGARAMMIFAEHLFRLDVVPSGDMVRLIVRALGETPVVFAPTAGWGRTEVHVHGDVEIALSPASRFDARIAAGNRDGPELARVIIATVRLMERGTVRFSAQAIVGADAP